MSATRSRLNVFIVAVAFSACGAIIAASRGALPFPGWWPLSAFVVVAALLEGALNTRLRIRGSGSISFVAHLSATLLFGVFWGACISAVSMLLGNIARGNDPLKTLFNVSQITLSIVLAATCYAVLGGQLPAAYLQAGEVLSAASVQRDLGLFFVLSALYFVVNSAAVSTAVALSSGRAFREVWNLNVRGVLAYDLGASVLAVLMAWLYARLDHWLGFGSLAIIILIVPIVAVRHVYGLYRQLQESGQELLELMVKAIEARDPYTSGHSVRVSKLSRTIAVELGLPAVLIEQIETAALLHDVGKIHEEFAPLLRKESRLTEAETALMQTHAARSADLVAIIKKFRGFVLESVRHHHERWDGRGYPSGLAADRIPIGARIILVSDTVDAMTTDRPYRKRLSPEVVLLELQKHRGSQFDPTIIDLVTASVAVRRLIAEPFANTAEYDVPSLKAKRLSWPSGRLWRARQA
jgi:hypothetical protein